MARHLVRGAWIGTMAVALALQSCGKPSPISLDRPPQPVELRAVAVDPLASRPEACLGQKTSERVAVATTSPLVQSQAEDPPPWPAELLHAPDPSVPIQALDAWARHRSASLDPLTYALVDPDESVRARAQEVM